MAKFFSGKDGSLKVRTGTNTLTEVAKLQNWSFSMSMAVIETTTLGDTDRTLEKGLRSYSGSARAYYYNTGASGADSNVITLLQASIKPSSATGQTQGNADPQLITIEMILEDGTPDRTIAFDAWVTSVSMSSSIGEISSVDINWEAHGAPLSSSQNLIG